MRLRDARRQVRSRYQPPWAAGCRHAGARVPWVCPTVLPHARQGNVMPLSQYRQRLWGKPTHA
jgi:hypothetical protein